MPRLQTQPETSDLTARERVIFLATAVLVALSRLLAFSASLWDWDEALFYGAIRDFDVTAHHPHPPGFPVYVGAAKLLALVLPEFRAYQALNVISSMALFPIVFLLAREMRFPKSAAYFGALLFAFLPNVWFYGGTALSDITGTALVLLAAMLLLRGRTDGRAYVLGAVVLGLAAGVRSQALLIGCAPALIGTWHQWKVSRRRVFAAIACGAAVIAISYASAAFSSSSVDGYFSTWRDLKTYIRSVDSFMAPGRPSLVELFPAYFMRPMRGGRMGVIFSILAGVALLLGLVRRDRAVITAAATFLPFAIFTWLMLDFHSISRYSVAFLPLHALLAAHLPHLVPRLRHSRYVVLATAILVLPLVVKFWRWTMPALNTVRATISPTEDVLRWVDANLGARGLYVHGSMSPFVEARLPHIRFVNLGDQRSLENAVVNPSSLLLIEDLTMGIHAGRFVRDRGRTFELVRQRYFEVALVPATEAVKFGEGWYGVEGYGTTVWQWMSPRADVTLPAITVPGQLTLRLGVPAEKTAAVVVKLDDEVLGRFDCAAACERQWIVPSRGAVARRLEISTDASVKPSGAGVSQDGRDLALRLDGIGWVPARE